MAKRLTRKEQQAHTRKCLMHSAGKVFARRGLQQASIDEVATDAGYTRGAFYANFASKEELFLAMLDERFAERLTHVEELIAGDGTHEDKARAAGADFAQMLAADPEWRQLFLEFSAYAARNEAFREELVTRYRWLRERIAAAITARATEAGIELPIPAEQLGMMTCALANGFATEKLLEGDDIPDELFGSMLAIFFTGLNAMAEQASQA